MKIRGKIYQTHSSEKIKTMFSVWGVGFVAVLIGLLVFPQSQLIGLILIAISIIAVPFFINVFLR